MIISGSADEKINLLKQIPDAVIIKIFSFIDLVDAYLLCTLLRIKNLKQMLFADFKQRNEYAKADFEQGQIVSDLNLRIAQYMNRQQADLNYVDNRSTLFHYMLYKFTKEAYYYDYCAFNVEFLYYSNYRYNITNKHHNPVIMIARGIYDANQMLNRFDIDSIDSCDYIDEEVQNLLDFKTTIDEIKVSRGIRFIDRNMIQMYKKFATLPYNPDFFGMRFFIKKYIYKLQITKSNMLKLINSDCFRKNPVSFIRDIIDHMHMIPDEFKDNFYLYPGLGVSMCLLVPEKITPLIILKLFERDGESNEILKLIAHRGYFKDFSEKLITDIINSFIDDAGRIEKLRILMTDFKVTIPSNLLKLFYPIFDEFVDIFFENKQVFPSNIVNLYLSYQNYTPRSMIPSAYGRTLKLLLIANYPFNTDSVLWAAKKDAPPFPNFSALADLMSKRKIIPKNNTIFEVLTNDDYYYTKTKILLELDFPIDKVSIISISSHLNKLLNDRPNVNFIESLINIIDRYNKVRNEEYMIEYKKWELCSTNNCNHFLDACNTMPSLPTYFNPAKEIFEYIIKHNLSMLFIKHVIEKPDTSDDFPICSRNKSDVVSVIVKYKNFNMYFMYMDLLDKKGFQPIRVDGDKEFFTNYQRLKEKLGK